MPPERTDCVDSGGKTGKCRLLMVQNR